MLLSGAVILFACLSLVMAPISGVSETVCFITDLWLEWSRLESGRWIWVRVYTEVPYGALRFYPPFQRARHRILQPALSSYDSYFRCNMLT